mmetsp:Transcript_23219/g.22780  ORF Transcript_23219/g.22780 Transcript_23219/m.22780 type:complete len:98 (+) Transcript_23219:454-747(+)
MICGHYVLGGQNLFTLEDLDDSIIIKTNYKSEEYTIKVDHETKSSFNGSNLCNLKMEEHDVSHTLLNLVIKEALRQTQLRQIGKNPRFFDTEKAVYI